MDLKGKEGGLFYMHAIVRFKIYKFIIIVLNFKEIIRYVFRTLFNPEIQNS